MQNSDVYVCVEIAEYDNYDKLSLSRSLLSLDLKMSAFTARKEVI